jgi:hypothetical protein
MSVHYAQSVRTFMKTLCRLLAECCSLQDLLYEHFLGGASDVQRYSWGVFNFYQK